MDDVLEVVTKHEEIKGASITLRQEVIRDDALLVGAGARRFRLRWARQADSKAAQDRARGESGKCAEPRPRAVVTKY